MESKRDFFRIASLLALVTMGCGSPAVTSVDAAASDTGPSDASTLEDAPDVDGGVSYPITHPCAEPCTIEWRELSPFAVPVDHHTTFVLERTDGAYLYVVGGIESDGSETPRAWNRQLSAARIEADGTLGEWEHEDLGFGIAFHAQFNVGVEVDTRRLLWAGGVVSQEGLEPEGNALTFLADFLQGSGSGIAGMGVGGPHFGRAAFDLPEAVLHGTAEACRIGDSIELVLVGGGAGSTLSDSVLRYTNEAGWVEDAPLPTVRSHHAMVRIDDHLYVLGGFSGTNTAPIDATSILRSVHGEDRITGWEEVGTLEEPPWTASSFVRDGFLYVVGGGSSHEGHATGFTDRVRRAPVEADGRIGAFEDLEGHLPVARGHVHQTPVYGDYVYSVGGRVSDGASWRSTDRVFVGRFLP